MSAPDPVGPGQPRRPGPDLSRLRRFEYGWRRAELSVEELWFRHLALGGDTGLLELDAFLHGLLPLDQPEEDVLAQALNERLTELYEAARVPHRWEAFPAAAEDGVRALIADVLGADRHEDGPGARRATGRTPAGARDQGPTGPWPAGETPPELAVDAFLAEAAVVAPHEVAELLARHAGTLGVQDAVAYLADLGQTVLTPLPGRDGAGRPIDIEPIDIEATPAGRSFRRMEVTRQPAPGGATTVWLPLLDGRERLGVLGVTVDEPATGRGDDGGLDARLRRFATLAGELVMSKTHYGDTLVRLRRPHRLGLAAELRWSQLPPLTFTGRQVSVAGVLEPGTEAGGDFFDYAVDAGRVSFAIFEGAGHGLRGARVTALAVTAYRNARRDGLPLREVIHAVDAAVSEAFTGAVLTAVLAELDTDTGMLRWGNVGHHEPLLLRRGLAVKALHATATVPFGRADLLGATGARPVIGGQRLSAGDRLLLYTAGGAEARCPAGVPFGTRRLTDLLTADLRAGLPVPEGLRRLVRSLTEHRRGPLEDDATLLFVEWHGPTAA